MKKPRQKYYTMWVHYKQGDDLSHHLEQCDNNTVKALREWADCMAFNVEQIRKVAYDIEQGGKEIHIEADTHHIGLHGPNGDAEEVLAKMCENKLIQEDECFEDEEEDWEEDEEGEEAMEDED